MSDPELEATVKPTQEFVVQRADGSGDTSTYATAATATDAIQLMCAIFIRSGGGPPMQVYDTTGATVVAWIGKSAQ